MKLMPRNERNARLHGLLVPSLFCLLAVIVFATQFAGTGLGEGHHGWGSSQFLAIASRATPANGFVGHARVNLNADGTLDYVYFDRTPVFFSAIVGALISLTDDLILKVWIARQVMLTLFVLSMLFAWLLLRRLGLKSMAALVAVTLGFSGYQLLYYREMVDFSQPALFGMLLLLYFIARVKLERRIRWRWLTVATLVAVSLGRAPVSWSVIGLWFAMEAAGILARRRLPPMQRLRAILAHDATRMLLLGLFWVLLMTGYNIAHEMSRRDVGLEQTSLVNALQRRLPGASLAAETGGTEKFIEMIARRLLRWFLPLDEASGWLVPLWLLALATVIVLIFLAGQPPPRRIILILVAASGLLWIFMMKNLTWYHDFTTMHAVGFSLVFWLALLDRLQHRPFLMTTLLLLSLVLFLRASLRVEADHAPYFQGVAIHTEEHDRILQQLGSSGQVIYSEHAIQDKIINAAKYVLSFYLGDNVLAQEREDAEYIVASRAYLSWPAWIRSGSESDITLNIHHTLTPENRVAFLFDMLPDSERMLPPALEPQHNFGNRFALGRWELHDSVQVQPCQRLGLDSWWQRLDPPVHDYSAQLVLAAEDGRFVAFSDRKLTTANTVFWREEVWYLDVRDLQIPCDVPAGDYSLLLIVYDPRSMEASDKLPLIQADGSAGDTWLYLTTLFVG